MESQINIKHFRNLSFLEKFLVLWDEGVYLARFVGKSHLVNLFRLGGFFVEVYYNKKNEDILYINTFEDTESLDKYLDQIDLEMLTIRA